MCDFCIFITFSSFCRLQNSFHNFCTRTLPVLFKQLSRVQRRSAHRCLFVQSTATSASASTSPSAFPKRQCCQPFVANVACFIVILIAFIVCLSCIIQRHKPNHFSPHSASDSLPSLLSTVSGLRQSISIKLLLYLMQFTERYIYFFAVQV